MNITKPLKLMVLLTISFSGCAQADAFRGVDIVKLENVSPSRYWALIIGIDNYKHWRPLKSAVKDAKSVRDLLLSKYGFEEERVISLMNEQATAKGIYNAFLHLKNKVGKNDSLFVYYAGHGHIDQFESGAWIPFEAPKNHTVGYLDTQKINSIIGKFDAKHIFLVADACYSGSLFVQRGAKISQSISEYYFLQNKRLKSRQALSSGGMEPVLDNGYDGHSIFAYYFLKQLRENQENYLPASWISAQVEKLVSRNAKQRPRWSHLQNTGDEDGEFFFVLEKPTFVSRPNLQQHSVSFIDVSARGSVEKSMIKNRTQAESLALDTARYLAYKKIAQMRGVEFDMASKQLHVKTHSNIKNTQIIDEKLTWRGSVPIATVVVRMQLSSPSKQSGTIIIDARGKKSIQGGDRTILVSYMNRLSARVVMQLGEVVWSQNLEQSMKLANGQQKPIVVKVLNTRLPSNQFEISENDMKKLHHYNKHSNWVVVY